MHIRTLAAIFAVLAVAACDQAAEPADAPADAAAAPPAAGAPAAEAFSYAATSDLSGYYMPSSEVRLGKWSFDHIAIGPVDEFRSWTGTDAAATYAPVMLQFKDETSPMVETELGETRSIAPRVLPARYSVSNDRIEFEGTSPELGAVRFEGRIDPAALASARAEGGGEGVVVTGTLSAAGQTINDLRMRWWMGD